MTPALSCLTGGHYKITGTFSLNEDIKASGKSDALVRPLQGKTEFIIIDEKFYRHTLLARILAVLNITEILRGKLPDMERDGFAYKSIKLKSDIQNGPLLQHEIVIEGDTMTVVGQGETNLINNKINLTVIIVPFKTINYIVSKMPFVRNILMGTLITIPINVTGNLSDPTVPPRLFQSDPRIKGKSISAVNSLISPVTTISFSV